MANRHMLYVLQKASPKLRKNILQNVNIETIKTLCEISINTLNGNNPICKQYANKLKNYKTPLRMLACPKRTLKSKRNILVQTGGFLPALLGSLLTGVIGSLIEKYVGK